MKLKTKNGEKEYATVVERMKMFLEETPDWSITTEILSMDKDSVVIKCTVYDENGRVRATGHAQEDRTSSMVNKTSYVENCETSAVGRALGFLGHGIDESIASYEETEMAIAKQNIMETREKLDKGQPRKISRQEAENLEHWIIDTETDDKALLEYFKVKSTLDLNIDQYNEAIKILKAKKK